MTTLKQNKHSSQITAILPVNSNIYTSDDFGEIIFSDVNGKNKPQKFTGNNGVNDLSPVNNYGIGVIFNSEKTITYLDYTSLKKLKVVKSKYDLNTIRCSGSYVVVGSYDGIVSIYDCKNLDDSKPKTVDCKGEVTLIAAVGNCGVAVTVNGVIYVFNLSNGSIKSKTEGKEDVTPTGIDLSPDASLLVVGYNAGYFSLLDITRGCQELVKFDLKGFPITDLMFNPTRYELAFSSMDSVTVYNLEQRKIEKTFIKDSKDEVSKIVWAPQGDAIFIGFNSGKVSKYDRLTKN